MYNNTFQTSNHYLKSEKGERKTSFLVPQIPEKIKHLAQTQKLRGKILRVSAFSKYFLLNSKLSVNIQKVP